MGADRGILVVYDNKDEIINTEITASISSKICDEENPDLVIMGKQAIDTDNHQTAEYLAELLKIGNASQANTIKIHDDQKNVTVIKEVDGGLQTISLNMPCVI